MGLSVLLNIWERPDIYEMYLRREMAQLGATKADFALVTSDVIKAGCKNKRRPEDLAWALMQ